MDTSQNRTARTTASGPGLFDGLTIRNLTLRNRIVVAPMLQMAGIDGHVTSWHDVHVGRFAIGGVGLIIMESTKVEARGRGTPGDLGLWSDEFVPGLRRIVEFGHRHGAAMGIQLGHTGRKSGMAVDADGNKVLDAIAPSAIPHLPGMVVPRALPESEIPDVIGAFAAATRRADEAGFDMVELHGAHGYLLHEFLSPVANQRTDRYGGSEENRRRLMIEVVEACRAVLPSEKPLFLRLSCEDLAGVGPAQIVPLVRELKSRGVDVVDCSSGGMRDDMREIPGVAPDSYNYQVAYSDELRREAGIATMAVGHIIHADQADAIVRAGQADLVAIGREMLYNPNWAIDAAQKLGVDPEFALVPEYVRGPLASRGRRLKGQPSTFGSDWVSPQDAGWRRI